MPPWGLPEYHNRISPAQEQNISTLMPYFTKAIQGAENNKKNHGVLSVPVSSPEDATKTLQNSIYNNWVRWNDAKQGTLPKWDMPAGATGEDRFVDFMQKRWAPLGATNDPDNLNKNWAPNVRELMKKQLTPKDYELLRALKIVLQGQGNGSLV